MKNTTPVKSIFEKHKKEATLNRIFDSCSEWEDAETYFEPDTLNASGANLPELSEIDVVRHFTRLSERVLGIDNGTYPLGSCTMKYNPKRNDKMANLSGFRDVHPNQPVDSMSGIWTLLGQLSNCLKELTGMDAVSLQPAAGAHGELAGLLMIRAYLKKKKQNRPIILIADSAHGTNPASATMAGFKCQIIPTTAEGLMDLDALESAISPKVAALMVTNPSTLGLFEENIQKIASKLHKNGSLLYYDGANLNALMGIVRPGDMGFDVMHINTHKTLSTPHGGGGPGAGPIAVKAFLKDFLPDPVIIEKDTVFGLHTPKHSIGAMKSFFGHVGILIKAYCYLVTMGPEGLREASENAVLNANYVQEQLRDIFPPIFDKTCMHECLLSGKKLKVSTFKFAKRIMDYNIHPPTLIGAGCVYFSDQFKEAMLIEPTETESKESLDELIATFKQVYHESEYEPGQVEAAPMTAAIARVDLGAAEIDIELVVETPL
ncbi:MAG: glycine dehydrogenase subunit 2 [Candidatus Marinamargulisbacteria bacterium]|jgi:glycine dehydrogenase subunit 2